MMASEVERNKRQQAERDAEAALLEADRARAQAKVDALARKRAEEFEHKERELESRGRQLESRERGQLQSVEAHVLDQRVRNMWFRLRRGVALMAQSRRMRVRARRRLEAAHLCAVVGSG